MEESINYILDAMQARVEFENIEEECARQGYLGKLYTCMSNYHFKLSV